MIVLDASVLIAHLDANDANHGRAGTALIETSEHDLAASPITLAGVLVGPIRAGGLEAARSALRDLAVAEVPLPPGAGELVAGLRASTGLKLPDCCVLLAAQQVRADAVLTFDERLAKQAADLGYGWWPDAGR